MQCAGMFSSGVRSEQASIRSLLLTAGIGFYATRVEAKGWVINIGPFRATDLVDWAAVEDFVWEYVDQNNPGIGPRPESEFCRHDGAG